MTRFAALGITNALRNLNRSLLTLAAMAVAGLMMTASLSVSEGHGAGTALGYRAMLGGDILVYAGRPVVDAGDLAGAGASSWSWRRHPPDLLGPLAYFSPPARYPGYALPTGEVLSFAGRLEEIGTRARAVAGVTGVNPYWVLPVPVMERGPGPLRTRQTDLALRAREVAVDPGLDLLEPFITSGRSFRADDDGALVALVDAARRPGDWRLTMGETVTITVPRPWIDSQGIQRFDYTTTTQFELRIIGTYALATRVFAWETGSASGDQYASEELFFSNPELMVPLGTFKRIVGVACGRPIEQLEEVLLPTAVLLSVENFAFVEAVAAAVDRALEGVTVVSVPRQAALANQAGLPEPMFSVPAELRPTYAPDALRPAQEARPVDVARVFNVALFLVAALVAATNATILVMERRREIGVLKAIGSRTGDIMVMVMVELLLLSLLGATAGFVAVRIYATGVLLSTGTAWSEIAGITWREWVLVLSATAVAAAGFGLIPALGTLRMTAAEVLRQK